MKNSKTNIRKKIMMNEDEVYEMQSKIDEGIFLAQKRLVERARHNHTTLVVARGGQIVEVSADELYPVRRNYCSLFSK